MRSRRSSLRSLSTASSITELSLCERIRATDRTYDRVSGETLIDSLSRLGRVIVNSPVYVLDALYYATYDSQAYKQ